MPHCLRQVAVPKKGKKKTGSDVRRYRGAPLAELSEKIPLSNKILTNQSSYLYSTVPVDTVAQPIPTVDPLILIALSGPNWKFWRLNLECADSLLPIYVRNAGRWNIQVTSLSWLSLMCKYYYIPLCGMEDVCSNKNACVLNLSLLIWINSQFGVRCKQRIQRASAEMWKTSGGCIKLPTVMTICNYNLTIYTRC